MPEEEPKNVITDDLTKQGRMLLVTTALLGAGALYLIIEQIFPQLPSGRYSLYWFLIPVILMSAAFFWLTAKALETRGIKIYRKSSDQSPKIDRSQESD